METRRITLYSRPACELCVEARTALRRIAAASSAPLLISEINVEEDPVLHQRYLTEIPVIEYEGQLLSLATSRMRITTFIANVDLAVRRV